MLHANSTAALLAALSIMSAGAASPPLAGGGEGSAVPAQAAAPAMAFLAATVHVGDGRVIEDGVVIVERGVIRRVGKGIDVPSGAAVVRHEGALSPGLIALRSHDGGGSELHDSTRPVLIEADATYAYDPSHSDFRRCVEAGITALVLAPIDSSLVPGTSSIVKTAGERVVKRKAQLVLGFSKAALSESRFPTSYPGALAELERLFAEPGGLIARAAGGELPVLLCVDTRDEIQRALSFAGRFGLKGALVGSHWTEELAGDVHRAGLSVVCSPADPGDDERGLRSVLALAEADVPFGFALDAPARHPASLRFAAARAVRGGLDPARALQALTGDAAAIASAADRIGRIEPGRDADLVLWSGDPVDLTSSIVAVYVDGRRVHGGER